LFSIVYLHASEEESLAKKFNLYAGTKAIVQWERVFSSSRHLQKYKLDTLSKKDREKLKRYLLKHAADSDHPTVPGL
jgi:hypothetical protein